MKCPRCDYVSLAGSSFCEKCGTSLKAPSPRRATAAGPAPRPAPAPRPSAAPPPTPRTSASPPPRPAPVEAAPRPVVPPIPAPRASRPAPPPPPPPPPPDPLEELKRRAYAALEGVGSDSPPLIRNIDKDSVLVGRASPADGIVPDVDLGDLAQAGTISRRHARLVRGGDEILLEDLGSANGTFINGERLPKGVQKPVFENDEVRFGAVRFVFHWRKKART